MVPTDLRISGMFWTQNLKPLTICFALGVVHITEEPGCSVGKNTSFILDCKLKQLNIRKKLLKEFTDIFLLTLLFW